MRNLIIIGAGDFGREAMWVAERMNKESPAWNILGFVDDGKVGEMVDGYPVLGNVDWLCAYKHEVCVTCAVANGKVKESIWKRLDGCAHIQSASLIDPVAIIGKNCVIGDGCIICAGTVLTVNVSLGKSCIINLNCTIGHDSVLMDYCTVHPGSNISGKVTVGKRVLMGTGTRITQGLQIAQDTMLGAGAVIVKDITESGTYVGVPARKIKE